MAPLDPRNPDTWSQWAAQWNDAQRQWLDDDQFMSALEISQTLPGLNATNMSVLVGSRLRGVSVDSTVVSLLDRGLLEEAGRPPDGGAMRYRTTRLFQERFGLRKAGDLPPLENFELTGPEAERVRRHLIEAGHLPEGEGPADGG